MCRLQSLISKGRSRKRREERGEQERETANSEGRNVPGSARTSAMANKPPVTYIPAAELVKLKSQSVAIVDVRDEEREYDGHIAGSLHYPSASFHEKLPDLLKDIKGRDTVVFHCAMSQIRGPTCARSLAEHLNKATSATATDTRRSRVVVLERGFNGWSAAGRPVCSCPDARCTHTL